MQDCMKRRTPGEPGRLQAIHVQDLSAVHDQNADVCRQGQLEEVPTFAPGQPRERVSGRYKPDRPGRCSMLALPFSDHGQDQSELSCDHQMKITDHTFHLLLSSYICL